MMHEILFFEELNDVFTSKLSLFLNSSVHHLVLHYDDLLILLNNFVIFLPFLASIFMIVMIVLPEFNGFLPLLNIFFSSS